MNYFKTKSIAGLLAAASEGGGLKRTLGPLQLILLGIGAIIGAGLFVRTAAASAEAAGPSVTLSFVVAAIACAFAGLCYAEFSSMIPIAGSAYTYAYATMGEIVAWIIGWSLILEYALGAATVSIAWSEYLNKLLENLHIAPIPYEWCHSPLELSAGGLHGIMNLPALFILFLLTLLLIRGTQESAMVNGVIVFLKVAIVLVFIVVGWQFINPANQTPYFVDAATPDVLNAKGVLLISYKSFFHHGWGGVVGGAAIVFFAFIGFDAVSTAAQEAKNPERDMPIGILGSLVVCTILYILFAHVLTGVASWHDFADPAKGKEASVAYVIQTYMKGYEWLGTAVTLAILAGFSSVILVMLMGQSRVFFSMSKDGLLPKMFSDIHPRFRTPYKSNWMLLAFVGLFAAFVPGSVAGDLTSIGTLFAFALVCAGIIVMRRNSPELPRPFRTPLVPLVPILGIGVCGFMIISLPIATQLSALGWMVVGLGIYFMYGVSHSRLQSGDVAAITAEDIDNHLVH